MARIQPPLEATYKARDVEGILDLYFYRKVGYRLAREFARLRITPAGVSLLGALCGVIAGHLYYYRNLTINIVGMALHICANMLDNADGQLARLTGAGGRNGRIIDGVADHLVFLSIYVHLTFRCLAEGASPLICLLVIAAAISHALQGAAADYYRTTYLYFVKGNESVDLDFSSSLRADYKRLSWRFQPWDKLLVAFYWNFTRQQELLSPWLKALREISRQSAGLLPGHFGSSYRTAAQPMFKLWGLLMTNTRMVVLFVALFINRPLWFFWFELLLLNLLLVYLVQRQETMAQSLTQLVEIRPK